ncbi:MAG: hypothetical protein M3O35_13995 [Acidobacteriota bacterium]|nr:hypothetical protein [Acidobacteriota bacterium]
MHRAGTSLCTNVLAALGMRLGPRLLPGDLFNENGYFEEPEIFQTHEHILATLERSWDMLEAASPFPSEWWKWPAMDPFKERLEEIVQARIGDGPGIWGFKDPRTVALMPLWSQVFATCGVTPVFVLCVRHPGAVAGSLAARDRFSALHSELLWFEKTLSACRTIQSAPHCVIRYEDWFQDPLPQVQRLRRMMGFLEDADAEELRRRVASIVNPELRHQMGGMIHSRAARQLYARLVESDEAPAPELLRQFEFVHEAGQDYVASEPESGARFLKETVLREIKDRVQWMARCSAAEHALLDRDERLRAIEDDRARWMDRWSAAQHALMEKDARLSAIEEDRMRWVERCAAAEHAVVETEAHLREFEEDKARWMARCTAAEQACCGQQARLSALEEDHARWIELQAAAEQDRQRWKEQLASVVRILAERDSEIAALRTSATWRWTQNALSSWPARQFLGPLIRAAARRRTQ